MSKEINSVSAKPQENGEGEENIGHDERKKTNDENTDGKEITKANMSEQRHAEVNESLIDQEQRIERVWSDNDRRQYREKVREFEETVGDLRYQIEEIRTQADSIWDNFVSLSLEMIMQQKHDFRRFLENLQIEADTLTPEVLNTTGRIDVLLADIAGYQRLMGRKIGLLESMAHRISTQNHLNMMIARVSELEAQLLGRKPLDDAQKSPLLSTRKMKVNIPSDLLYLRVRLRTTRASMMASRYTKQVADTGPALYSLLFRAERLRSELTVISTRMACLNDQAGYWLAYIDMPDDRKNL